MARIYNIFTSLSSKDDDDCLANLEEIWKKLLAEDRTLRPYRRTIGFGQNIRKDLLPLLTNLKDDNEDSTKLIDLIVKILVNLTIPIEYLLSIDLMLKTDYGQHTINELNHLLIKSKECFTDNRHIKLIIDHIKFLIDNNNLERHLNYCDSINNCLLLIRNILHIPEIATTKTTNNSNINCNNCGTMQNQIIWNLFTQSIDKILIYLISCPQKMYWNVTIVQLIALLYKDQHIGKLEKLLNLWLESTLSESSDDNESNTSPPEQGSGDDSSSPIITSDPTTSDSSDNGGSGKNRLNNKTPITKITNNPNRNKSGIRGKSVETESSSTSGVTSMTNDSNNSDKNQVSTSSPDTNNCNSNNNKKRESSQSEDFGYGTQVETQESISTSSNEDYQPQQKPVHHQKLHTLQKIRSGKIRTTTTTTALEKKELRRKKLVKRSKANMINMKGLMHHLPTDDDISNILKEFTVDFLLKGYNILVNDLHKQLLSNISHVQIDTSHFFWLVTYFLKFATQLELDLEHVNRVLSIDILTFLIFQSIWIYEELEIMDRINDVNIKPCLRRLHLVVTAIHEFLQAVEAYQKMLHLNDDDRSIMTKLQHEIVDIDDLRLLFLLLLRQYNPNIQSKQYLKDLIITNHNYLLFLDNATTTITNERNGQRAFNIMEHLKQFATNKIMYQYGLLLEDFKNNGEYVNNCIFTMMHHIGGDLDHLDTLFQPIIIKTFSQIWETDYEICDDWSDLIEYIIHKFINSSHSNTDTNTILSENSDLEWTKEDKDNLLNYYKQSKDTQDTVVENIRKKYENNGIKQKTQLSIIQQLLDQNIINETQYNEFIRIRQPDNTIDKTNYNQERLNDSNNELIDGDIKAFKEHLYKENKGKFIQWLQEILINICYVKLILTNIEEFSNHNVKLQPIIYYYTLLNLPVPLVAWTIEQNTILKHQPFILLLHKLGLYLPIDTGKIFITVPNYWSIEHLFNVAQQLGPIDAEVLKFDVNIFKRIYKMKSLSKEIVNITNSFESSKFSMNETKHTPTMYRPTPITSQLSINIPNYDLLQYSTTSPSTLCNLMQPPELSLVQLSTHNNQMDYSPINHNPHHNNNTNNNINDDNERNSMCETASIASDLTRMCVSDEDDNNKIIDNKLNDDCTLLIKN